MKDKIDKYALIIIRKWLKKGNMARAMRDVLPNSRLTLKEREKVAELVHDIVRYKRYYDFIMENNNLEKNSENYIMLSKKKPSIDAPKDIVYSFSPELFSVTPEEFVSIINREPDTTLCINLNKISREEAIEKLRNEGFKAQEYIPESAVITDSSGRYSSLVKGGLAIVQDATSQIIAKIAGSLGEKILDYCAGSGGKSLAMYSFYSDKEFYVYDKEKRKLRVLEKRAEKWGMDVNIFWEKPSGEFSVVLVDAPCSGVGAAARNPEVKYRTDFKEFSNIQLEILDSASDHVQENGFLVYVVCSYTLQETEEVIEKFLSQHAEFSLNNLETIYEKYMKRVKFGTYIFAGDIFYISILKKM